MRYAGARQQGLTEDKIAALDGATPEVFTRREQVALRFAELMTVDHHKVDDALFAALKRYFTAAEIVELGVNVALYLGLGRFTAVLGVDPEPACH